MKYLMLLSALICCPQETKIYINQNVPFVKLSKNNGHFLDSNIPWSSKMLKGEQPTLLMYVDPDNESENKHVEKELQKSFPGEQLKIYAIINMKSSWLPHFAIKKKLRKKQKENKNLQVILDKNRNIEKKWGLAQNNYHVLLFDKKGVLIFYKKGKLAQKELINLKKLININFF